MKKTTVIMVALAMVFMAQADEKNLKDKPKTNDTYLDEADKLFFFQYELLRDLQVEMERGPSTFLESARKAMDDSKNLLEKPKTGKATQDAEKDAINLILAELQEMSKGQGKCECSADAQAQMQMMMQMMGLMPGQGQGQKPGPGQGNSPGQSTAGGDTKDPGVDVNGNLVGPKGPDRKSAKVAGRNRNVPEEFKSALQGFFKAVETKRRK